MGDGGIVRLEMAISGKSKIKKLVAMGANDLIQRLSTLGLLKVLQSKKMIKKIQRKKTLHKLEFTKQLLGLLGDKPKYSN
jgi:hypothetical protein